MSGNTARFARISSLDGLRTVAIVIVVLYHLHVPHLTGGFIGVNIFYVLSGYLISSILLREHEATGRIRLGRFWVRRLLRLYPALFVMVVVAALIWPLVNQFNTANTSVWAAAALALTYTSNIGRWLFHHSIGVLSQTWSLAMEEQFYLVWPPILVLLLALRARRTLVIAVLAVLVVASAVAGWLMYAERGGSATPDVYFSPVLNLGPLLTGVALALLVTFAPVRRVLSGVLGEWFGWIGAAGIVAIVLAIGPGFQESRPVYAVLLPLTAIASVLLIASLISRPTLLARTLSFGPISWFGRNGSYSLYLWHVMVIALIEGLIPNGFGKALAFAAAVVIAIASHYLVEKPFLRLKDRLEPSARETSPAPR